MTKDIVIDDAFVTIKKGAIIRTPNPKWDGDVPSTQFYTEGEVSEDFTVFIGVGSGTHPVTITHVKHGVKK